MNFLLLLLAIALFVWIFKSSNNGNFSTNKKELSFDTILYSEYGYIIALVAKLAKSDGRVSELEVEFIENILDDICNLFEDKQTVRDHLKLIFKEEKEVQDNVAFVASELYTLIKNEPRKQHKILEFLINLAFIDGSLERVEKSIVYTIAKEFEYPTRDLEILFEQFETFYTQNSRQSSAKSDSDYYAILDVDPECSNEELKRAYKKGVKNHHPDIIMSRGGSSEEIKEATKRMQDFNAAYETLKKRRGL